MCQEYFEEETSPLYPEDSNGLSAHTDTMPGGRRLEEDPEVSRNSVLYQQ